MEKFMKKIEKHREKIALKEELVELFCVNNVFT